MHCRAQHAVVVLVPEWVSRRAQIYASHNNRTAQLRPSMRPAGNHAITYSIHEISAEIYLLRLSWSLTAGVNAGEQIETLKMQFQSR